MKSIPAGRLDRLFSILLDSFILFLCSLPGAAVAALAPSSTILINGLFSVFVGGYIVVQLLYLTQDGQTIGKKVIGIRVVQFESGEKVSPFNILVMRTILPQILNLVPLFFIVDSGFIFSQSRQCLHDRMARTKVVLNHYE